MTPQETAARAEEENQVTDAGPSRRARVASAVAPSGQHAEAQSSGVQRRLPEADERNDTRAVPAESYVAEARGELAQIHPSWYQFRETLDAAHVLESMGLERMYEILGRDMLSQPAPGCMVKLLEGHAEALGEAARLEARFVSHHASNREKAPQIVARFAKAAPELGELTLAREKVPHGTIPVLVGVSSVAALHSVRDEMLGGGWHHRTVSVDALAEAVNNLLAMQCSSLRFVPLDTPDNVAAFLAVTEPEARVLDQAGLWLEPLDELAWFTCFG